jgi:phenylpropionate dioxygenase-like ring-hydroxylating dioxygenase large terminal subunit
MGRDWILRHSKSQKWILQEDRCPHRSVKLSLGKLDKDELICPFHGFRFSENGSCSFIPEIQKSAPGLKIETYVLSESQSFLWVPWNHPQSIIPWFDDLNEEFSYGSSIHTWKMHFSRCVENQLDYAHLPFIHKNTIGTDFDISKKRKFERGDSYLKIILDESDNNSYLEYRFGNVWKLNITSKLKQMIAFIPVDEQNTKIYMRAYHSFTKIPILKNLISIVLDLANRVILNQDKRVVLSHFPEDVNHASHEKLFGSDRAIVEFRKWLSQNTKNEDLHLEKENEERGR